MNLKKNFRFKVGCDADDVLLQCVSMAVEWANRDYNFDPPLTVEEVKTWDKSGNRSDVILQYFHQEEFFKNQQPLENAQKFIRELSEKAEVFIVTAIKPVFMGIRANQIQTFFPEIPEKNYIPAYRKDVVNLDFLLDDGAHNILASNVKYPVLYRRPWNAHMTGTLAVNSYDEFLNLIDCIKASYMDNNITFDNPTVIALVGPSGSEKKAIALEIAKHEKFEMPISTTTRSPRKGESEYDYHFTTEEKFNEMKDAHQFAETSVYAGQMYGAEFSSISNILCNGKHCIIPIDISGAMALKMKYRTCIVYIKRDRPKIINALIERVLNGEMTKDDMTQRIVSMNDERKNEELCDYTLENNESIEDAANKILATMKIKA